MKQSSSTKGDKNRSGKGAALKLGAVALLLLLGAGCGHHAAPESASAGPLEVETLHPRTATLTRDVEQPGHLMAYESTPIFARIPGKVNDVPFDIGDYVKEGQVLAKLYVPEIKSEVDIKAARVLQAKADVLQAKESLAAAEANINTWEARLHEAVAGVNRAEADYRRWSSEYERDKTLLQKGVFDKQTLDEAQHQLKVSEASWEEARAKKRAADASWAESKAKRNKARADVDVATAMVAVAAAEHQKAADWYAYAEIKAPYDGIVTAHNVHRGHYLQPSNSGSTSKTADPIFTVMRTDVMRVTVEVPETDARLIKDGDRAVVRLQALSGREVVGTVTRKSEALDDRARTLKVEIHVKNWMNNNKPVLRHGMYANILIETKCPSTLMLPAEAVLNDIQANGDRSYCFIAENGKVKKTFLRVGVRGNEGVEVLRKMPSGSEKWQDFTGTEAVVVSNPGTLLDGQLVEVKSVQGKDVKSARAP